MSELNKPHVKHNSFNLQEPNRIGGEDDTKLIGEF